MLADFFNILLEAPASAPDYDAGEEHGGRQEDDLQIEPDFQDCSRERRYR